MNWTHILLFGDACKHMQNDGPGGYLNQISGSIRLQHFITIHMELIEYVERFAQLTFEAEIISFVI